MAIDFGNDYGGYSYNPRKKEEEEQNQGGGGGGGYVPDSVRFAMEAGKRANDYFASGESQKYYEPYIKPAEEEEYSWTPTDEYQGGRKEEEEEEEAEVHEYTPPADDGGGGGSQPENLTNVNVYTPTDNSAEDDRRAFKDQQADKRSNKEEEPVVFEGGTLKNNQQKDTITGNTKALLTGEEESSLPDWLKALQDVKKRVDEGRADLAKKAAELRANRQHYLGAGPTEPGTMNYTTATGPELPKDAGTTPRNYQTNYQYNPNLTVDSLTVNNPQWLAENGFGWAGAGQGAGTGPQAGQSPVLNLTPVSSDYPGGYQAMFEDGVRIRMDRGESREEAERNTQLDILRQNLTGAGNTRNPNIKRYEPPAGQGAGTGSTPDTRSLLLNPEGYGTALENIENEQLNYERGMADYLQNNGAQLGNNGSVPIADWYRQGIQENAVYGNAYNKAYDDAIANGSSTYAAEQAAKNAGDAAVNNLRNSQPAAAPEQPVTEGKSFYDSMMDTGRNGEPVNQRYVYRGEGPAAGGQDAGTGSGGPTRKPGTGAGGTGSGNGRPGVDAALNSWEGGAGAGTGAGTGTGTGTGSGSKTDVPPGSKYYPPSYGQEGYVVKAPYRKGGYSAAEIEAMGNKARPDQKYYNGNKAYEGYYLAPDGHYYPVDQVKANYYRANGGSYSGWDEGMRDYWNNFGTFYGYRPDWKKAGRNVPTGGGGYSGGGYSYSGTKNYNNANTGRSYGSGSTANNGIYWNPNTSWSI